MRHICRTMAGHTRDRKMTSSEILMTNQFRIANYEGRLQSSFDLDDAEKVKKSGNGCCCGSTVLALNQDKSRKGGGVAEMTKLECRIPKESGWIVANRGKSCLKWFLRSRFRVVTGYHSLSNLITPYNTSHRRGRELARLE